MTTTWLLETEDYNTGNCKSPYYHFHRHYPLNIFPHNQSSLFMVLVRKRRWVIVCVAVSHRNPPRSAAHPSPSSPRGSHAHAHTHAYTSHVRSHGRKHARTNTDTLTSVTWGPNPGFRKASAWRINKPENDIPSVRNWVMAFAKKETKHTRQSTRPNEYMHAGDCVYFPFGSEFMQNVTVWTDGKGLALLLVSPYFPVYKDRLFLKIFSW